MSRRHLPGGRKDLAPQKEIRARSPDELERLFVRFVNEKNLESLLGLYEQDAVLMDGAGNLHTGLDEIRAALAAYIETAPVLEQSDQLPAVVSGDIALTSSRHSDGSTSVEIARRQGNGDWRWVVDKFKVR